MATAVKPVQSPEVYVKDAWLPRELDDLFRRKRSHLAQAVKEVLKYVPRNRPGSREAIAELIERLSACVVVESNLNLAVLRGRDGLWPTEDYGWAGWRLVTTVGVNFIVDAFQNSTEVENFKFHGIGTGSTAESSGDTTLVTELTTEYNPDSTRATGSLTEGASANIFRTVGTNTLDGTPGAALREHGIFSAATGGTLLDRTVYSAITLSSGDSLASTYDLTISAGG